MVIRTCFVSNSSSSSFILTLKNTDYLDILREKALIALNKEEDISISASVVAKAMLEASYKDRTINEDPNSFYVLERLEQLKKLTAFGEADYIYFSSCNYDTEIFKGDKTVYIWTCRNESIVWDDAFESLRQVYRSLIVANGGEDFEGKETIEEKYLSWTEEKELTKKCPSTYFDIEEIEKNGKKVLLLSETT